MARRQTPFGCLLRRRAPARGACCTRYRRDDRRSRAAGYRQSRRETVRCADGHGDHGRTGTAAVPHPHRDRCARDPALDQLLRACHARSRTDGGARRARGSAFRRESAGYRRTAYPLLRGPAADLGRRRPAGRAVRDRRQAAARRPDRTAARNAGGAGQVDHARDLAAPAGRDRAGSGAHARELSPADDRQRAGDRLVGRWRGQFRLCQRAVERADRHRPAAPAGRLAECGAPGRLGAGLGRVPGFARERQAVRIRMAAQAVRRQLPLDAGARGADPHHRRAEPLVRDSHRRRPAAPPVRSTRPAGERTVAPDQEHLRGGVGADRDPRPGQARDRRIRCRA